MCVPLEARSKIVRSRDLGDGHVKKICSIIYSLTVEYLLSKGKAL